MGSLFTGKTPKVSGVMISVAVPKMWTRDHTLLQYEINFNFFLFSKWLYWKRHNSATEANTDYPIIQTRTNIKNSEGNVQCIILLGQ